MAGLPRPTMLSPLKAARDWLRSRVDEGERCPCCQQWAQVYRRPIHRKMAVGLVTAYQHHRLDWFNMPALLQRTGSDEGKLRYWGLLEQDQTRTGWWRVTPLGEQFLQGKVKVAKWARVYDGRCLGLDSSETVSIHDALKQQFDLAALLAGTP